MNQPYTIITVYRPAPRLTLLLDPSLIEDVEVECFGSVEPGTKDVRYLPNGDPGYPGDPPVIDIEDAYSISPAWVPMFRSRWLLWLGRWRHLGISDLTEIEIEEAIRGMEYAYDASQY